MLIKTNRIITLDDFYQLVESVSESEYNLSWDAGMTCFSVFEEDALSSNRLFLKKLNALIVKKIAQKSIDQVIDPALSEDVSNEE